MAELLTGKTWVENDTYTKWKERKVRQREAAAEKPADTTPRAARGRPAAPAMATTQPKAAAARQVDVPVGARPVGQQPVQDTAAPARQRVTPTASTLKVLCRLHLALMHCVDTATGAQAEVAEMTQLERNAVLATVLHRHKLRMVNVEGDGRCGIYALSVQVRTGQTWGTLKKMRHLL